MVDSNRILRNPLFKSRLTFCSINTILGTRKTIFCKAQNLTDPQRVLHIQRQSRFFQFLCYILQNLYVLCLTRHRLLLVDPFYTRREIKTGNSGHTCSLRWQLKVFIHSYILKLLLVWLVIIYNARTKHVNIRHAILNCQMTNRDRKDNASEICSDISFITVWYYVLHCRYDFLEKKQENIITYSSLSLLYVFRKR